MGITTTFAKMIFWGVSHQFGFSGQKKSQKLAPNSHFKILAMSKLLPIHNYFMNNLSNSPNKKARRMLCLVRSLFPINLAPRAKRSHRNWPQTVICQLASTNEQHADHRQITRIQNVFFTFLTLFKTFLLEDQTAASSKQSPLFY